jgi:hypothetical protein
MLSAARVPIVSDGYGKGNRFVGNFSLYPLDWTDEEAVAFGMLPNISSLVNGMGLNEGE